MSRSVYFERKNDVSIDCKDAIKFARIVSRENCTKVMCSPVPLIKFKIQILHRLDKNHLEQEFLFFSGAFGKPSSRAEQIIPLLAIPRNSDG